MLRSPHPSAGHHTPGTIDLVISNPVILLNEIAKRYETSERILMEYVDNALDDAEILYRRNNQAYPYPIEIDLIVDHAAATITIQDNCQGMPRDVLEGIVRSIGESNKRGLTWVNGRFGFGVHAFRAAAENIRIQTKHERSSLHTLEFNRSQLFGIKEAQRSDEKFPTASGSGTIVTVSKFDREWFAGVSVESIRHEIERHFERLLDRPGLSIRVREVGQPAVTCRPFDYRALEGVEIQQNLELEAQGERFPIELYLKIAATPQPEHSASFFSRGRRVAAMAEIKSFMRKSRYDTGLWGHPHLCGYVEVGEMVEPILNRDDFVRTKRRQALYEAIAALEAEIRLALLQINQDERSSTLDQLEDTLRNALAQTLEATPNRLPGLRRPERVAFVEELPGGGERRADFTDGVLTINMAHADFRQRLSLSRQGIPRLSDRLNAYLAGVLATFACEAPTDAAPQELLEAQLNAFIQIEENLRQQRANKK